MSDPIKEAPTDVLCDAARTLQKAHDFVEMNNFNINVHGQFKGSHVCCFIGSVHQAAGEHNMGCGEVAHEASRIALRALDLAAIRKRRASESMLDERRTRNGGVAEMFGFEYEDQPLEDQKEKALPVYRKAIREVQAELMTRKDLPVPA